jgi:hypothetical protein
MKYTLYKCAYSIYLFLVLTIHSDNAVTFVLNGGRFGDNLISCAQAYWIHYRYNMPLLFVPFPYSELLRIHYEHPHYTESNTRTFAKTIYVSNTTLPEMSSDQTLYVTTFTKDPGTDWSDTAFVDAFRTALSPSNNKQYGMPISDTTHSIAMHIRRGGSFSYDKRFVSRIPQQFPVLDFYVQSLCLLLRHLIGPCTLYLFTDDKHPKDLAKKIMKQLSSADRARVHIVYRQHKNNHDRYVLDDFFSMMQCKYLIRPCSHFSLFAELLGSCVLSIYPAVAMCGKNGGIVTTLNITVFLENESYTERMHISQCQQGHFALFHTPLLQEILAHPAQKILNRRLQSTLPFCY